MSQVLIPTDSFEDWRRFLADPAKQWRAGFSAMTLAKSWEHSKENGFPPEIRALLDTAGKTEWAKMEPLVIIPEYKVPLPGGNRPSQTDLVCVSRAVDRLVAIAVEGKVEESLGPTMADRRNGQEIDENVRLSYLCDQLGLKTCPDSIRYQLLHRTVSALEIARRFLARDAVMLVHSFSPSNKWLADFEAFAALFGKSATAGQLVSLGKRGEIDLYIGWASGDQRFRT